MSEQPLSTDAEVASPAFTDDDRVEGAFDATSIRAVMINRPREELYAFWRDFRNLPRFMENVKSVELLESGRSSWLVAGPAGSEIELVSEIVEDRPGEYIAWRSLEVIHSLPSAPKARRWP